MDGSTGRILRTFDSCTVLLPVQATTALVVRRRAGRACRLLSPRPLIARLTTPFSQSLAKLHQTMDDQERDKSSASGNDHDPGTFIAQNERHRGILVNDSNGLCLAWKGAIDTTNAEVYTNLTRLASQLPYKSSGKGEDLNPLVTIETETAAWLIKEYEGGHTVVQKVPMSSSMSDNSANTARSVNQSADQVSGKD